MTAILEIPENPELLPGWMEVHLVGPHLGDLILEIEAIRKRCGKPVSSGASLEQVLGSKRQHVLAQGLRTLPVDRQRYLLRHPRLLLGLQELIFTEGGEYWRSVPRDPDLIRRSKDGWKRLQETIAGLDGDSADFEGQVSLSAAVQSDPVSVGRPSPVRETDTLSTPRRRSIPWVAVATTLAASLLSFLIGWQVAGWNRPAQTMSTAWGWDRPGILAVELNRTDYLNHLANLAAEWANLRPDNPAELRTRLTEFRHACDTLIAAPHPQLLPDDRTWLVERCRAWSKLFDDQLARLAQSRDAEGEIESASDTVATLVTALRERSKIPS